MANETRKLDLIERLYQLAVEPAAFNALLEEWEATVEKAVASDDGSLNDALLRAYRERTDAIMDRISQDLIPGRRLPLAEAIELDPHPALLVSRSGDCLAANAVASERFGIEVGQNLATAFSGRVSSPDKLKALIRLLATREPEDYGILGLLEVDQKGEASPALLALSGVRCIYDPRVACMLTLLAPIWNARSVQTLKDRFGLSEQEIESARRLAGGVDADTGATLSDLSFEAVQAGTEALLEKTRLDPPRNPAQADGFAEPDLADVRSSSGAFDRGGNGGGDGDDAVRFESLTLSTGRRLEYTLVGPRDGRPVLYVHGLMDSTTFPCAFLAELERRGILLVAPSRPHFSHSDPYLFDETSLEEFADYAMELLDHLGIAGPVPVLGHMAGALYAVALAGRYRDRVSAILSVAGAVPMRYRWQVTRMSTGHRISAITARHAPGFLAVFIRASIRLVYDGREEAMLKLVLTAPQDLAIAQDPELHRILYDRFRFVTSQGGNAFKTDIVLISADWTPRMAEVTCPLVIVHGTRDPVVVIEGVRAFAEEHHNVDLVEVDAGQLALWAEYRLVLDRLEAMLEPIAA